MNTRRLLIEISCVGHNHQTEMIKLTHPLLYSVVYCHVLKWKYTWHTPTHRQHPPTHTHIYIYSIMTVQMKKQYRIWQVVIDNVEICKQVFTWITICFLFLVICFHHVHGRITFLPETQSAAIVTFFISLSWNTHTHMHTYIHMKSFIRNINMW